METPHAQPTRPRRLERQHLRRSRPAQRRRPAAESPNRQQNLTADEIEKTHPSQSRNLDRRGPARPLKPAARKVSRLLHRTPAFDAHRLRARGRERRREHIFSPSAPLGRGSTPKGGGGVSTHTLPVILTRHPTSSNRLRLRNPTDTSPSASARGLLRTRKKV